MAEMWTLAGLSPGELLRRTIRESWEDSVFGQGGRMAFYQFLAIFPCLLMFLDLSATVLHNGGPVTGVIGDLSRDIFPQPVSRLFLDSMEKLRSEPLSDLQLAAACAGAAWSALNGTWAMVYGLNRAYEVDEHRSWWSLGATVAALTLCLAATASIAVFLIFGSADLAAHLHRGAAAARIAEWVVLVPAMCFSFAVLYRFAPDVRDAEWRWSTPGAVCALIMSSRRRSGFVITSGT